MTTTTTSKLKRDINKLRFLLIGLTLIQVGYIVTIIVDGPLASTLTLEYHVVKFILALQYMITGIFIWYNWKRMPIDRKKKVNHTWMLIILGVIGMWLWMPNKQEMEDLVVEPSDVALD